MSEIIAMLEISERNFPILAYSMEFSRKTKENCCPCSSTQGGRISLLVPGTPDTFLVEAITNAANKPFKGKLLISDPASSEMLREILFQDAYLVHYKEECNTSKAVPLQIWITIAARILEIGVALHKNNW